MACKYTFYALFEIIKGQMENKNKKMKKVVDKLKQPWYYISC